MDYLVKLAILHNLSALQFLRMLHQGPHGFSCSWLKRHLVVKRVFEKIYEDGLIFSMVNIYDHVEISEYDNQSQDTAKYVTA